MTDKEYYGLIQPYEDAMKLLLTRLEVLNHSIYKTKTGKPVHNIQYRIKKKDSIEEKLVRHGFEPTLENAKDQLQDIAGVRIICYFVGDVNNLVNMLKKQPDLIFIRERNYIENPKPNGYRSHHVILGVNVCCLDANALERMKTKYNELKEKCRPFLEALEHFPEVAKLFTEKVKQLFSFKEAQERAEKEAREKERQERIKARRKKRGMER